MRFRAKTYLAGLTAALLSAGLITSYTTYATNGGSGGVGGPGIGTADNYFSLMVYDADPGNPAFQGFDNYSTTWFMTNSPTYAGYNFAGMDGNSRGQIYTACRQALDEADDRYQAASPGAPRGQSRVVAIGVNHAGISTYGYNATDFRKRFDAVYGSWYKAAGGRIGYWNDILGWGAYDKAGLLFYEGIGKAGSLPRVVCVAFNRNEPAPIDPPQPPPPPPSPADYELEVNTRAHSMSTHEGNTSTANDTLNLSMREVCDADECTPPEPDNITGRVS